LLATLLLPGAFVLQGTAAEAISYNRDIRPILAENCFSCHGPDPGGRKAGLRLDTEAGLFERRKEDPAPVLRGKPEESELYKRLITKDQDEVMPPPDSHKALKPGEIALLKRWIESGAPWQKHWAFIPPEKAPLPAVGNAAWVKNPIDQFVLAKLETRGLSPAPEADARRLFRRVHLDLTGLPPTPEDVDAFVAEFQFDADGTLSQWVDRLMQSKAWGEHRARYWLDAARYGDTHGLHIDNYREMWPFRDWVIRAFNANKLFSEFTVEQIAGDLLPQPTENQLIATGFQRCNITTAEGGTIAEENLANYAADRVQTMGWVYLGLTTNCSQCHDHKFDPFTTRDYYSMAAFFRNTTQGHSDRNTKDGGGPVITIPSEADRPRWKALPGLIGEVRSQRDARRSAVREAYAQWLGAATRATLEAALPAKDLQARIPLNEGSGNTGKVVAPAEAPEYQSGGELKWVNDGKLGPAPLLGKDTAITAGDLGDFEKNQSFSFGLWVKTPAAEVNGMLLGRSNTAEGQKGYELSVNGKAISVTLTSTASTDAIRATSGKVVKPGVWQHVFVTYDGSAKSSGLRVYVDGKLDTSRPDTRALSKDASIRTKVPLRIGGRLNRPGLEEVAVQEVRMYGRKLSDREVKDLADGPALVAGLEAGEKRSKAQGDALFEHYLAHEDSAYRELDGKLVALEAERDQIKARSPLTHIQEEVKDKMPMANILMRGQYNKVGEAVEAVPPAALHPLPEGAPKNRLGLAQWLVDKANPLTPRVTVNRFWQEVFGQGIVRTPEDFGIMGAAPSHGELLDWLAADFRDNGGDVRRLFKLMVTSATYRQSAAVTPEKLEKDRDNALLSRGPRFRMDGEMVRDYALAASGLLSSKMYGPSVKPYQPENIWDVVGLPNGDTRNYVQDKGENLYRRTVYNFWKRMAPPPNMDLFNAPSRDASCVRRERTNTPLQALVTLNDPQFVEAARVLAEKALVQAGGDAAKAVDYLVGRVLGRAPNEKERSVLMAASKDFSAHYGKSPEEAKALIGVGESKPTATIDAPVLAAWTMVSNQVLNLDEALNK
jgi:mono/diheme cytochrome c family protein